MEGKDTARVQPGGAGPATGARKQRRYTCGGLDIGRSNERAAGLAPATEACGLLSACALPRIPLEPRPSSRVHTLHKLGQAVLDEIGVQQETAASAIALLRCHK